jgi:hypothetical protein
MKTTVNVGGGQRLEIKGAVLVYSGSGRSFCAWHEAREGGSREAQLSTATALTSEFVRALRVGLSQRVTVEILPDQMLAMAEDIMVWWTPA